MGQNKVQGGYRLSERYKNRSDFILLLARGMAGWVLAAAVTAVRWPYRMCCLLLEQA